MYSVAAIISAVTINPPQLHPNNAKSELTSVPFSVLITGNSEAERHAFPRSVASSCNNAIREWRRRQMRQICVPRHLIHTCVRRHRSNINRNKQHNLLHKASITCAYRQRSTPKCARQRRKTAFRVLVCTNLPRCNRRQALIHSSTTVACLRKLCALGWLLRSQARHKWGKQVPRRCGTRRRCRE